MSDQSDSGTERAAGRRGFITATAATVALAALAPLTTAGAEPCAGAPQPLSQVRALVFDVFGTVVDWRSSIIREGQLLEKRKGVKADWVKFADAWRGGYQPAMKRVRSGELPWVNIDGLNRIILNDLLVQFRIDGLSEEEIDHLNRGCTACRRGRIRSAD